MFSVPPLKRVAVASNRVAEILVPGADRGGRRPPRRSHRWWRHGRERGLAPKGPDRCAAVPIVGGR